MAALNRIVNVAIVGAGGNVGKHITQSLLKSGKHTVRAITRVDSQSQLPDGVEARKVDYGKPETLVEALKGHDALVITLSGGSAIKEIEEKLVNAAAEAGVRWILPNEWSPDTANEELVKDVFIFQSKVATRKTIEALGKSSYISVVTGFWYEYCMARPGAFGFDIVNRMVTFFDQGEVQMSTTTLPQVGRAVAALLGLPIKVETAGGDACLEKFRNKMVYVNSFTVNQKEIMASLLRVTETHESDWTTTEEPARKRYSDGVKEMKEGKFSGMSKMMFTRVFFDDGAGDFEHHKGTLNSLLGLPVEDFDEATMAAVERSKTSIGH